VTHWGRVCASVFAIAESPKEKGLIWAGTNDGWCSSRATAGKTGANVTKNIPGLPPWGTVSTSSLRVTTRASLHYGRLHQVNNRDPFVYKTSDYGATWTPITTGIPHTVELRALCS